MTTPLLVAGPAQAGEQTLIFTPGEDYLEIFLDPQVVVGSIEMPQYGDLPLVGGNYRYEPRDEFWTIGKDVVLIHDSSADELLRFQIVAGQTATDDLVVAFHDPGTGPWQLWQINNPQPPGVNDLEEIVPGAFTPMAHKINGSTNDVNPSFSFHDDGGATGSQHANANAMLIVTDLGGRLEFPEDAWLNFFEIKDGLGADILKLQVRVNGLGGFNLRMDSPQVGNEPEIPLPVGHTAVRVERFNGIGFSSGAKLFVDDSFVSQVPIPNSFSGVEDIVWTLDGHNTDSYGIEFVAEDPGFRRSDNLMDPTTREIYDDFGEVGDPLTGLSSTPGPWTVYSNTSAMSYAPQGLPGPGRQLDFDLGHLRMGESSYISYAIPGAGTEVLDPKCSAIRFWFDTSNVSLDPGTEFTMASICGPNPPCGAVHARLRHTPSNGYDVLVTSLVDGGPPVNLAVGHQLTAGPHLLEIRLRNSAGPGMKNGLVEVWLDGALEEHETRLDNHTQQASSVRFGAINDQIDSSGTFSVDEVEAWRFE